jgi:predicted transcriptional regulator
MTKKVKEQPKTDFLLKLFIRSYLQRKNGLTQNIKLLKNYYVDDEHGDPEADAFNTSVTTSILDVYETLMKNDDLLIKFTEMVHKYDPDSVVDSETSDTVFDIDDKSVEDDFDMDKIKKELENVV